MSPERFWRDRSAEVDLGATAVLEPEHRALRLEHDNGVRFDPFTRVRLLRYDVICVGVRRDVHVRGQRPWCLAEDTINPAESPSKPKPFQPFLRIGLRQAN